MRGSRLSCLALSWAALTNALPQNPSEPSCRFARQYAQKEILKDPSDFINDLLYWEGKFHQNNVSYNSDNGMSYDGTNIDFTTGERTVKHPFSAASKESLQIMLYAHAVAGSPEAARFLTPQDPSAAPDLAVSIMEMKLQLYLKFNETFRGFGGYLPWFTSSSQDLTPTWDWNNRVPGLGNGELLWAVYAFIQALENRGKSSCANLASEWQKWIEDPYGSTESIRIDGTGVSALLTWDSKITTVNAILGGVTDLVR